MLFIGKYNHLVIERLTSVGFFLTDEQEDEVLLPNKYITDDMHIGDTIKVFVYNDSEDRPVATTETPKIVRNEFAYLQVKDINEYGAFLDCGLEKDLFVPFREQQERMQIGDWYIVFLYLDPKTGRLVASSRINRHLDNERLTVKPDDEVDIIFWQKTDLGYNVIVNHYHRGLVYGNEVFRNVNIGDQVKGYVKVIRPENKLDIGLVRPGYTSIEPNADKILNILNESGGFLGLSDNSAPEEITRQLEMSKKVFKKAIGGLYKKGLIRISDEGIYLNK
jgi:predicted RNA-binding protein (virulence factor B family)